MKHKHILTLALAGLVTAPAFAQEAPAAGDILDGINMYAPEEGAPAYKVAANEKYGTQWYVDMAYGYWHGHNTAPDMHSNANLALLHAFLNQRIIEDSVNGGTWLRFELSGSWGLDRDSAQTDYMVTDAVYGTNYAHTDVYGGHDAVIPELSLMHHLNGKRTAITAGLMNLTNYFDCVGIANDSFSSFVNSGFVNSTVLCLPDANLGAMVQHELDSSSYAMVSFTREVTTYGDNPFDSGTGYLLVGEYGRTILDGAATIRFNPFFRHVEDVDGHCNNFGLAASIEYEVNDELTVYARTGWGARQELGNAFDFSCGANIKLIPSREDDFLGVALGVFKPCAPADNNREFVAEAMYSLQVNDYFKVVPHIQYISNPAYDADCSDAVIMGVQGVFSF